MSFDKAKYDSFFQGVYNNKPLCDLEAKSGRLTIMGTGIRAADFLSDLRPNLMGADIVLYCVADPVTESIIKEAREDALDLSVLYSSGKSRYSTYVQMAEAMIAPVRRGQRVLVLFYGHPGIFAMPTHRAMAVAKAEGLSAVMRPGISALDYLIADVGFDPAYPGLLTYEATDLLLRQRSLDPSLHLVIWQVGVVGEMGFERAGFKNDGLSQLVDLLESRYANAPIVHYIGSRFPGVRPLIEHLVASDLRRPEVRKNISALSTLYIPPARAGTTDAATASAFGIVDSDTRPGGSPPTYDVSRYGKHETQALEELGKFSVPSDYKPLESSPAIELMLDLTYDQDAELEYLQDAGKVISKPAYANMAPRAKVMLMSGDVKAAHISMYEKGISRAD